MKKLKKPEKLTIKKVTLKNLDENLDEKAMEGMAGGTLKLCTAHTFCGASACTNVGGNCC